MFERFTEQARQVIVLAQEEARLLNHNYIGTEHLLLGLLREEEGLPARVLESLGVTVERVRAEVVAVVGSGAEVTSGQIPFTPRAKKVLELALREGVDLGHNYLGTEHVLLGLLAVKEGVAARVLVSLDADPARVRPLLIEALGDAPYPPGEPVEARAPVASRLGGLAGAPPVTPRLRAVLDLAWRLARQRGEDRVGTLHLLLALAEEAEGALEGLDADGPETRELLLRILRAAPGDEGAS
jgi:ATP-dependent Clp protease ATP-binding subunit ClpA